MKKIVSKPVQQPEKSKKGKISRPSAKNKPLQCPTKPAISKGYTYNPLGGRPPKYNSVEELEILIDAYFKSCWTQKIDMFGNLIYMKDKRGRKTDIPVMEQSEPYTITGLAIALDTSREGLLNYEKKDRFFDTIKRAKEKCHGYAEKSLYVGKNPTGAIFNLKNNYGWRDKTETEHTGNLTWTEEPPK